MWVIKRGCDDAPRRPSPFGLETVRAASGPAPGFEQPPISQQFQAQGILSQFLLQFF